MAGDIAVGGSWLSSLRIDCSIVSVESSDRSPCVVVRDEAVSFFLISSATRGSRTVGIPRGHPCIVHSLPMRDVDNCEGNSRRGVMREPGRNAHGPPCRAVVHLPDIPQALLGILYEIEEANIMAPRNLSNNLLDN